MEFLLTHKTASYLNLSLIHSKHLFLFLPQHRLNFLLYAVPISGIKLELQDHSTTVKDLIQGTGRRERNTTLHKILSILPQ